MVVDAEKRRIRARRTCMDRAFGAQTDHSQGNDDDTGTTKAERVIEFLRYRTMSRRVEDRPA